MLSPLRSLLTGPVETKIHFEYKWNEGSLEGPMPQQTYVASKCCPHHIRDQVRVNIDNQIRWKGWRQVDDYVAELIRIQISQEIGAQIVNRVRNDIYWRLSAGATYA